MIIMWLFISSNNLHFSKMLHLFSLATELLLYKKSGELWLHKHLHQVMIYTDGQDLPSFVFFQIDILPAKCVVYH